jgi:hypothetical protein
MPFSFSRSAIAWPTASAPGDVAAARAAAQLRLERRLGARRRASVGPARSSITCT